MRYDIALMKDTSLTLTIVLLVVVGLTSITQVMPAFADHIYFDNDGSVTVNGISYPVANYCDSDYEYYDCLIGASTLTDRASQDMDFDSVENDFETNVLGTDPTKADTDGDGWPDGTEIIFDTSHPDDADTDDDGLTDPNDPIPYNADIDNDGLTDGEELIYGTRIHDADTDGDDDLDGWEIDRGYDPLNRIRHAPLGTAGGYDVILATTLSNPYFVGSNDVPPTHPLRPGKIVSLWTLAPLTIGIHCISFQWVDPLGNIIQDVTGCTPQSTLNGLEHQESQVPYGGELPGEWKLRALFYSDYPPTQLVATSEMPFIISPLVVPEFPVGSIAAIGSSLAALGGYLAFKMRKNSKD
jgi:hypothetical protein